MKAIIIVQSVAINAVTNRRRKCFIGFLAPAGDPADAFQWEFDRATPPFESLEAAAAYYRADGWAVYQSPDLPENKRGERIEVRPL